MRRLSKWIVFLLPLVLSSPVMAQAVNIDLGADGGGSTASMILRLIALLTVLSLAPSILIMVTCFTRIVVALSFLKSAMGTQQTPPPTVVISLAMFLTMFVMAPTFEKSYEVGIKPLINEQIDEMTAFKRGIQPFKEFMLDNVRKKDVLLFLDLSKTPQPEDANDLSLRVLIPAFMISELKRAFEIGFLLFIPFLVVDMVVASVLMSMGMMMLPPVIVSLPFKIIFFVLIDGWYLIAGSLVRSYGV